MQITQATKIGSWTTASLLLATAGPGTAGATQPVLVELLASACTPQMVVNGSVGVVGSDPGRTRETVATAGNARLATISPTRTYTYVKANNGGLRVAMTQPLADATDKMATVWLAESAESHETRGLK